MIKALADLPGFLFVAHRALQIPARHVEADRVAEDMLERTVDGDVASALVDRRDQLDLVMIIFGQRRIGVIDGRADGHVLDRVGRLLEKERRLARRIRPHLPRMRGVVASNAIDPSNRKQVAAAGDGNEGRRHRERTARLCRRAAGHRISGDAAGGKHRRAA